MSDLIEANRGKKRFIQIHGHSEFSLLDGGAKIQDIIDYAYENGQDSIAITDHGVMYGVIKALKYAKEKGVKLLVGCELYITPYGHTMESREFAKGEKSSNHLIVIAKNNTGYKNLCKLCSIAWSKGFYYKPRIDRELLTRYSEGLIVTSACIGGSLSQAILDGQDKIAEEEILFYKNLFGDDYYIEIQDHDIPEEKIAMDYLRNLAKKFDVKMVVGIDSHYMKEDDKDVHDALICIGTGQKVDGERRYKFKGTGYHYMTEQEVIARFPNDLEAIYNTGFLADKCDDDVIPIGKLHLPYFDIPDNKEFEEWEGEYEWFPDKQNI